MALETDPNQLNGNVFDLASLRGGLDDTSPQIALAPDACILAENVEFVHSTLGERRQGCIAITLPSDMQDNRLDAVTWMYRHLPVNDESQAELWALTQSFSTQFNILTRRQQSGWSDIVPVDPIDSQNGHGYRLSAQSLHGKLFLAHSCLGVDRLHVFDGVSLRRAGLGAPSAPNVANTGSGSFVTTRYYRVRFTVVNGSTVTLRSEPSATTTFSPSGTGSGAQLTKPPTTNENETNWEVEASLDNANFYRIASVPVGTTTYTDSTPITVGYNTTGNSLSESIGAYTTIPSGKFVVADQDRLLIAGAWINTAQSSRIMWTPVFADTGSGNDERLDMTVNPYLDLDGFEGGEITGMSRAVNGYIYVFKRSAIYRLVRSGQRTQAYQAFPITKARGAIPGSLVESVDQSGLPCLYFLDQTVGPCRLSSNGLQWCGRDIQTTWQRVNINATVPCHGVYYSRKRQLHYWLAVDGADTPNYKIIVHVNEMQNTDEGARRGWVTVALNNRLAQALCSCMFANNIDSTNPRSFSLQPLIGKQSWVVGSNTIRNYIQLCDTGGTDAFTNGDTLAAYNATITSKPFAIAGLLSQHEIVSGALLAKADSSPDGVVFVQAIGDFGTDEKTAQAYTPLFTNTTSQTHVIKILDDLKLANIRTVQFSLGDLDLNITPPNYWELHRLQLRITSGLNN